jgi:4-aminobutyrate aminotransferase-like enzyme
MNARQVLELLKRFESRNVTFIEPDGSWPTVWERARGAQVWDADGNKYLDLTAAFGVAAAGHANPRVVKAGQRQMAKLPHAMGDVHPHALKAELARELSRITFERWTRQISKSQIPNPKSGKTIFCNSGFEAVEAALKTAMLATGKGGVIAFEGAYHGLGYGALNTTHRAHFRSHFRAQLGGFGHFVPFPAAGDRDTGADPPLTPPEKGNRPRGTRRAVPRPGVTRVGLTETESQIRRLFRREKIGAVLVEPIQVRGGINIPRPEFLPLLRRLCDEHGALLVLDEIYTGFGRTGEWFACEHSETVPDILCLGKAMTGGFPLSGCVGRSDVMDAAWPPSTGEAIHTSTFLGHPVGCAMALAQIKEITRLQLVRRSSKLGLLLLEMLSELSAQRLPVLLSARGLALLAGLEVCDPEGSPATKPALRIIKAMLRHGFIVLPEGEHANVVSFTPPLTITVRQLQAAIAALAEILKHQ